MFIVHSYHFITFKTANWQRLWCMYRCSSGAENTAGGNCLLNWFLSKCVCYSVLFCFTRSQMETWLEKQQRKSIMSTL